MKSLKKPFPSILIYVLISLYVCFLALNSYVKINHLTYIGSEYFFWSAITIHLIIISIIIRDILELKINGKLYWGIILIIFNVFGVIGYLLSRKELLKENDENELDLDKEDLLRLRSKENLLLLSFLGVIIIPLSLAFIFALNKWAGAFHLIVSSFILQGVIVTYSIFFKKQSSKSYTDEN